MKKKLPAFKTDDEAARFLDRKDLSDYINIENMVPTHFEFERKTKNLTMRIPASLLEAVKARAARQGIPYQRFIRQTLERVVTEPARYPGDKRLGVKASRILRTESRTKSP